MIERKFNKAAIIISALAVIAGWFLAPYFFHCCYNGNNRNCPFHKKERNAPCETPRFSVCNCNNYGNI